MPEFAKTMVVVIGILSLIEAYRIRKEEKHISFPLKKFFSRVFYLIIGGVTYYLLLIGISYLSDWLGFKRPGIGTEVLWIAVLIALWKADKVLSGPWESWWREH